jgi:ABC-type hemin transport system substrate-binding protein
LSPEAFIASNPDVIVLGFNKETEEAKSVANAEAKVRALLADKRIASVNAIKNRRLLPVDEDVLTRRGYRVHLLIEDLHRRFAVRAQ